ncbi:DNA-binding response regulator, partial [bacterium]|nr:DNA-binding response regulator [bacterium]
MGRLLIIDDDRGITTALSEALSGSYEIDIANNGKTGIYKTDQENYEAIVLDLNLPDIPGLSVCQQIRERGVITP